jgi:protein-tyrosine phosphatase
MSAVLGYLYLGGKLDAKDKEKLQKMGIKYILNCTPPRTLDKENGCPNYYEKEKSFVYKRIPIFDNKGEDITSHLDAAYAFIEEGKHYGKVLVHCHKGVSRSASFVIGYLMRKNEFTFDEALAHVQMCRSVVQPNTAFVEQLRMYSPHSATSNTEVSTAADIGIPLGPETAPSSGGEKQDLSQGVSVGSAENCGIAVGVEVSAHGTAVGIIHDAPLSEGAPFKSTGLDIDDNAVRDHKRARLS